MNNTNWNNTPIVITTRYIPRIKTKWKWLEKRRAKIFGYRRYDVQEVGNVLFYAGKAYMTETDYKNLESIIPKDEQILRAELDFSKL